ncbi:MAG TPA: magnesium/cobalt transporter CorA [Verrucomicrobiae bacterium]|nr:magnesium/cobalt transporter CorA [Verrucomicrobiae bacterium]
MIRSLVFTTQGRLHSQDIDKFLIPTLLADTNLFLWLDLDSATPDEARFVFEGVFHFHPLSIEDCLMRNESPKVEEFVPREDDRFSPYLFIVIHAVDYSRADGVFATNDLDCFLGKNFLVTHHTTPLKVIQSLSERCLKGGTPVARAPDRTMHTLLDAIVENYQPALDELANEIGDLEQRALEAPTKATLNKILQVKKEILHLRQIIGPQREVMSRLANGEFKLIRPHLLPYYRDVLDAISRIGGQAQANAEWLTGILQIYLNMSSNQTGEVVKLLTVITFMTTPMMMIGTWYGMNFKEMPELNWRHGYAYASILTLVTTAATYWYFKKKKWF